MSLANLHTLQDSETDLNSEFKQQRFAILQQLEGWSVVGCPRDDGTRDTEGNS